MFLLTILEVHNKIISLVDSYGKVKLDYFTVYLISKASNKVKILEKFYGLVIFITKSFLSR